MGPLAHRFGLFRQFDENGLGDILGQVRLADQAERCGVNHIDVPLDQFSKCLLGALLHVLTQQFAIIPHGL